MNISDIRAVVLINVPYDTGFMYSNGTRFLEDSTKFSIIYDGNVVPYIPYTEYKWVSPKWHGKPNPNEGWIKDKTVNDLNLMINTASSSERATIRKRYERKNQVRDSLKTQGNLQSIKGNENR